MADTSKSKPVSPAEGKTKKAPARRTGTRKRVTTAKTSPRTARKTTASTKTTPARTTAVSKTTASRKSGTRRRPAIKRTSTVSKVNETKIAAQTRTGTATKTTVKRRAVTSRKKPASKAPASARKTTGRSRAGKPVVKPVATDAVAKIPQAVQKTDNTPKESPRITRKDKAGTSDKSSVKKVKKQIKQSKIKAGRKEEDQIAKGKTRKNPEKDQ